jgi:rRNA-processing protein FCF1
LRAANLDLTLVLRVVLDTSAINWLVDTAGAVDTVKAAVAAGAVDVMRTHVNIDEVEATPDAERRGVLRVCVEDVSRPVPTGTAVFDVSRYGEARYGSTLAIAAFEGVKISNPKHVKDALIAATAFFEDCVLVTRDNDLARRARKQGLTVMTPDELVRRSGRA